MKEKINELNRQLELYSKEYMKYDVAIRAMQNVEDFAGRNFSIVSLIIKSEEIRDKKEDILNAIRDIQGVCEHPSLESAGNDSHYSYEKCRLCGHIEKC